MNFTIFVSDRQFTNDKNLPLDEVCLGLIQVESIWYELLFSCKSFKNVAKVRLIQKKSPFIWVILYGLRYMSFKEVFPQRHQKP